MALALLLRARQVKPRHAIQPQPRSIKQPQSLITRAKGTSLGGNMPGDRLLGTLLRSLQTHSDQQDSPRLLGGASSLLTTLNNPLNITLLTSQLLSAPAIWTNPEGLRTSAQSLTVFRSAAQALLQHEVALKEKSADDELFQVQFERTLPKNEWIKAVINGADDSTLRWRHLLVLGGLLLAFGPLENESLSRSMRSTIESALVVATNHALLDTTIEDELGQQSIALVLTQCFPFLADHERARLDYDSLLPILMRSTFYSHSGLQSAYFLGAIDVDVVATSNSQFGWSERSPSYRQVQNMLSSPLLSSFGPLCNLIGYCIECVRQPALALAALEDVNGFSKTLHSQWRRNKLSEIDASESAIFLSPESLRNTIPQLWKFLTTTLFGTVIILRSIVGRTLNDGALASSEVAPKIATQTLETLRCLYFIIVRAGFSSNSQYIFVNLTAMDILAAYPSEVEAFIRSIRQSEDSIIPQHPLDRNFDLFFLNTAEHFTLVLSSRTSEDLLIPAASPYLAAGGNNNLLTIFEAAHSVMLAIFSAPQNAALTTRHLPFYIEALFNCFPHNLTARQFRLAFKTLSRLTSPPAVLAATEPMLSATLLELLYGRAKIASAEPMFPLPSQEDAGSQAPPELSEQAVLTLTVIDTLTQLSLDLLQEWLPLAAEMANSIEDRGMREYCKEQFWHALVGGEMDPDRSEVCHAWWSTRGGRDLLLFCGGQGYAGEDFSMSGALPSDSRENKL